MTSRQLIELNKANNKENFVLKLKINELEKDYNKRINDLKVELSSNSQKYCAQVEQDQATIESSHITIEGLETIIADLKSKINQTESLYHQERELVKVLTSRLEMMTSTSKENLDVLKSENFEKSQQISKLHQEKVILENRECSLQSKIYILENNNSELESENKLLREEIKNLKSQLKQTCESGSSFRKSLAKVIEENNDEFTALRESTKNLELLLTKTRAQLDEVTQQKIDFRNQLESQPVEAFKEVIEKLNNQILESENSRKSLQGHLLETENKMDLLNKTHHNREEIIINEYKELINQAQSDIDKLNNRLEDQLKRIELDNFKTMDLKLEEIEIDQLRVQNECLHEKVLVATKENKGLGEEFERYQKHLISTCNELLLKNKKTIEQAKLVKDLHCQVQSLEESLGNSYDEIKKLHSALAEMKKSEETIELPPAKKDDEIDQKLREIMIKTKVPVKFIRIGEGLYIFGSKRIHVKILNSKLVIRIGGGYMYIEEFIRLYAQQELAKLKNPKEEKNADIYEADTNKTLTQEDILNGSQLRELEHVKGIDVKLLSNSALNVNYGDVKKMISERSATPEKSRDHHDSLCLLHSQEQVLNGSIDNVFYEITPKIEFGSSSKKKQPLSQRTKTPDYKNYYQFDNDLSYKGNDLDSQRRTPRKNSELLSAREGISARAHSKR